jgi:hypothetical protein
MRFTCSTRPRAVRRVAPDRATQEFAGYGGYGYCRSHSRFFWGFRLYLLCAPDGLPIAFALFPANLPERDCARMLLEREHLDGYTVLADKGFAGEEFEHWISAHGAQLIRPDRRDEPPRFGSLGHVRQWIESVFASCKGQLGLERHNARTLQGLAVRIALRLLALAAAIHHNHRIGRPGRHLAAYAY